MVKRVDRVVISARKQMAKAKAVLTAEANANPDNPDVNVIRKIEALEKLIAERKQVSFVYVTSHVLWPYLPWLVPLYYQYQTRCGTMTSTGAFFSDLVRTGAFEEIRDVNPRVFGKWFAVARQLYDEGLHDQVEAYLRQREVKIREARAKARKEGQKYTYDLAPKIDDQPAAVTVPELEAVLRRFAESQQQPAQPVSQAPVVGAPVTPSIAPPAMPAAREAPTPTKTPIRSREEIKEAFLGDLRQNDPVTYETLMAIDDLAVRDQDIWTLITAKTNAENKSRRANEHKNLLSEIERKNLERAERRRLRETPPSA